jgi:hypothetical protein
VVELADSMLRDDISLEGALEREGTSQQRSELRSALVTLGFATEALGAGSNERRLEPTTEFVSFSRYPARRASVLLAALTRSFPEVVDRVVQGTPLEAAADPTVTATGAGRRRRLTFLRAALGFCGLDVHSVPRRTRSRSSTGEDDYGSILLRALARLASEGDLRRPEELQGFRDLCDRYESWHLRERRTSNDELA